jgi:predicted metallopeptidase
VPAFEEAVDLQKIAKKLIAGVENVDHVDIDEVLFLREFETKPKHLAKCYKLGDHPIGFFTDKKYCIVFYWACCDYMSAAQMTVLVLHELMHIPSKDDKLIDHDVQDFRAILGIDLDWSEPGTEVPDILGKQYGRSRKKTAVSAV